VKAKRKPKWQKKEIDCLLHFIRENKAILQSSFTNEVTNKRKMQLWTDISEKISSELGVAEWSVQDCRDKWTLDIDGCNE
jgi:hypothetical protein